MDEEKIVLTKAEKAAIPNGDRSTAVELLRYYIKKVEHTTTEKLHDRTGVPIRTITDMRSKKCRKRRFDLRYVVAVSIGLHMTADDAFQYVHDCGYGLRKEIPEEYFLILLLHRCGKISVTAANAFLVENHQAPLTIL